MTDISSESLSSKIIELIKLDVDGIVPSKHYFDNNELFSVANHNLTKDYESLVGEAWINLCLDELLQKELFKSDPHQQVTRDEAKLVISMLRDNLIEKIIRYINKKLSVEEIINIFDAVDTRTIHPISSKIPFMTLFKYGLPVIDDFVLLENKTEIALVSDCVFSMIPGVGNNPKFPHWGYQTKINGQSISFPEIFDELKVGECYMIDENTDPNPIITGTVLHNSQDGWRTIQVNIYEEWSDNQPEMQTQIFLHDKSMLVINNVAVQLSLCDNFYNDVLIGQDMSEYEDCDDLNLSELGRFTCNIVVSRYGKVSLLVDPLKTKWSNSSISTTLNLRKSLLANVNNKLSRINAWL